MLRIFNKENESKEQKDSLYVKIRQWFQPYWRPMPAELKALKKKSKNKTKNKQAKEDKDLLENSVKSLGYKPSSMKVYKVDKSMTNIFKVKQFPNEQEIWYYHDETNHQIIAHVCAGDRNRHDKSERSDEERTLLKPKLYPKLNEPYHRTHLIPFGYVGTENDPRLVVGWSGSHNSTDLNDFEIRQSNRKEDIYWYTGITRTKYGAMWQSVVVSVETGRLLDSLQLKIGTPSKPVEFYWE